MLHSRLSARIRLVVDRSTTWMNGVDWVETGWIEQHSDGPELTIKMETATLPSLGSRVRIPFSAPKLQVRGVGASCSVE